MQRAAVSRDVLRLWLGGGSQALGMAWQSCSLLLCVLAHSHLCLSSGSCPWQQRSLAGGKHVLGAAAGRDQWRAAPSQLVLWSPLQCLLSCDPFLSTPINICLLHFALPAYLGTCSHIPKRSLHQPQGLLPREFGICGSGAWCRSCMTWDTCFYHRQGGSTTSWGPGHSLQPKLQGVPGRGGVALAAYAALWE